MSRPASDFERESREGKSSPSEDWWSDSSDAGLLGRLENSVCGEAVHDALLGRYQIIEQLGKGAFGVVYLAHDPQLERRVALKVPRKERFSTPEQVTRFVHEARSAANLKHPLLVAVYDVQQVEGLPFIVQEYVEGENLSNWFRHHKPSCEKITKIIIKIADALGHVHQQRLTHCDLKLANVLIDADEQPHVADFGLAQHNSSRNSFERARFGTPYSMAPEQVRGEGHRLDARTDIWAIGVVMYELLTGQRPFMAEDRDELFDEIESSEPAPLRLLAQNTPRELERICLKCLSKRQNDRYATTAELSEDLKLWLYGSGDADFAASGMDRRRVDRSSNAHSPANGHANGHTRITPKGLVAFSADDAEFFPDLLPGPRDRDGLPKSIKFWRERIEETESESTFSIGLIYGPSGAGKTSLVKAGVLPCLSEQVMPIYVQATADDTEARLLSRIRKQIPELPTKLSFVQACSWLREQGSNEYVKVVFVIDQFEQWLHSQKQLRSTQLVDGLRQCDGGRLQAILMVRDDFFASVHRLFQELDTHLAETHNYSLVDRFDIGHAKKILRLFGESYERVNVPTTTEQETFIANAVDGLAQEGKVASVRLALFADMMKAKPWVPNSLKHMGGVGGVGVTYLDETFASSTAPPARRVHAQAIRKVLEVLLPEEGSDIKGSMKSKEALADAAGYKQKPAAISEVLHILDTELRIISPTEPEPVASDIPKTEEQAQFYQLTHDYLVPSLREWLGRKRRETTAGRAELKLEEREDLWHSSLENRDLPSAIEWAHIRMFTNKSKWKQTQKKMMAKAARVHGVRLLVVLAGLMTICVCSYMLVLSKAQQTRAEGEQIVKSLLRAETAQVPLIINDLASHPYPAQQKLRSAFRESPEQSNAKLHAALALLPYDSSVLPFLRTRLLTVLPRQFEFVRDLVAPHKTRLVDQYWQIAVNDEEVSSEEEALRFRAACALASFDNKSEEWHDESFQDFIVHQLVHVRPSELLVWINALRPAKSHLTTSLAKIYRDPNAGEQVHAFATEALADYLSEDGESLFNLLADANLKQFPPIFDKLSHHRSLAIALGDEELVRPADPAATNRQKESLAIRKANTAVMMMRMGESERVWPTLEHSTNPIVRSYLIHWLGPRGANPQAIVARLKVETNPAIKMALLLCLGEFQLTDSFKESLVDEMMTLYQSDPDPGIHAAAEWLLRQWKHTSELREIDVVQSSTNIQIEQTPKSNSQCQGWYLNSAGQTFVVLSAGQYLMGSPETESERDLDETQHHRTIDRVIAISAKEVTKEQWRAFSEANPDMKWTPDVEQLRVHVRTDDSPMTGMTWYEAAWYCNWLSSKDGVPEDQWCYEQNPNDEYGPGMKAKPNFLELTGYRLPLEAEWEYACRAGANSSRYFGETEVLLPHYAWYLANSGNRTFPVASLKPNDFGLFDMQGNVYEWCHDAYEQMYPVSDGKTSFDTRTIVSMNDGSVEKKNRVLRGGAFVHPAAGVRSARRYNLIENARTNHYGFRPARTYVDVIPAR